MSRLHNARKRLKAALGSDARPAGLAVAVACAGRRGGAAGHSVRRPRPRGVEPTASATARRPAAPAPRVRRRRRGPRRAPPASAGRPRRVPGRAADSPRRPSAHRRSGAPLPPTRRSGRPVQPILPQLQALFRYTDYTPIDRHARRGPARRPAALPDARRPLARGDARTSSQGKSRPDARAAPEGRAAGDERQHRSPRPARRPCFGGPAVRQGRADHHPLGESESRRPAASRAPEGPVSEERYSGRSAPASSRATSSTATSSRRRASSSSATASQLLLDPGTEFQEDFLFARNQEADTPADGVVTGVGTVGGRAGLHHGQRLHGEGRLLGREDGAEDRAHPGARAAPAGPAALPRRRGGRAHLGADQDLPGPLPRRPHLLQRGPALRRRAPGLHPVRAVAGRLGLSARRSPTA